MAIYLLILAIQACLALLWIFRCMGLSFAAMQIGLYFGFALLVIGASFMAKSKRSPDISLIITDGIVTFLWLCSLWQMTIYSSRPWLAQRAYLCLMIVAVALKCAWKPLKHQATKILSTLLQWSTTPPGMRWCDILIVLFIFLVIYIPDPQAVAAWLYFGEQFHQWDGIFMGVDLGLFHGLLPDVHIISIYGFGLPVIIAGWMKLFGGLSYANAVKGLFWTGIIYYVLWYFLLKQWFKSALLAFAAIVLGMRTQMFDQVVVPIVWTQPPASVFRYFLDALFFWSLYGHIKTQRKIFLWSAALIVSAAMFHMMSTGTLLLATLVFYAGIHLAIPAIRPVLFKSWRDFGLIALMAAAAVVLMVFWTWLVVGPHAFTREFWSNVTEYNNFFYNFVQTQPITEALDRKEFLYMLVGLLYPVLYTGTVLYALTMLYLKKADAKLIFAAALGAYGFFLHAYYILVGTKYSTVGLPGVFLAFFWADHLAGRYFPDWRPKLRWALLGASLFCLLTAHMFIGYPNLLNFSRNPIVDPLVAQTVGHQGAPYFNQLYAQYPESLKLPLNSLGEKDEGLKYERDFKTDREMMDYYYKDSDFSKDVRLIDSLTPPGARVPLISSFDVLILMQADRLPFFYYFPLLNSHPMRMRNFIITLMLSRDELLKTLQQLETQKPEYVFMERIFLTPQVPAWYGYEYEDLIDILRYVLARYEPVETGQYLVAMKRRG